MTPGYQCVSTPHTVKASVQPPRGLGTGAVDLRALSSSEDEPGDANHRVFLSLHFETPCRVPEAVAVARYFTISSRWQLGVATTRSVYRTLTLTIVCAPAPRPTRGGLAPPSHARSMSAPSSTDPGKKEPPRLPSNGEKPSLDELKRRLSASDADAFEQIFRRLSEPVFRYVCGMTSGESVAHDITQDTFAKLWSVRDRTASIDSLRAYVFRMARNRVYNLQRNERTRRDNREELKNGRSDSAAPSPDRTVAADMLREQLDEWIDELPERQREALILRRQRNMSHDEIADVMGIAPSTVNNHITRAMKHLRDRLHDYRPDLAR